MVIFSTIYFIFSYIQTIPQIIKLLRTKSSNDYSIGMILFQFIGVTSWTIFILTSNQKTIVVVGALIDEVLMILVDLLILIYYNFKKKR